MCRSINYFEHSLHFISAITGCLSIAAFASEVAIPVRITSSAVGLQIRAISAGIEKYKSTITNNNKKLR